MSKGFNLILIERDSESISRLEDNLRRLLPDSNQTIVRIVLDKSDPNSINLAVNKYVNFPVKIFVNCKSSKKT
jgi:short-subunit dehydrogenase